jgi:hypothetical protein
MREGCKSSMASEARGSGAGERRRREILTEVSRRGGDDEADRWGPVAGQNPPGSSVSTTRGAGKPTLPPIHYSIVIVFKTHLDHGPLLSSN